MNRLCSKLATNMSIISAFILFGLFMVPESLASADPAPTAVNVSAMTMTDTWISAT